VAFNSVTKAESEPLANVLWYPFGVVDYHDTHSTLPPGCKGGQWGAWLVFTLPYLEQNREQLAALKADKS
jgi:hypothetical protein